MRLNRESVQSWLGFSRRERRSASLLLGIIFFIIGVRYVFPEQNIKIENWGTIPADPEIFIDISDTDIYYEKPGNHDYKIKGHAGISEIRTHYAGISPLKSGSNMPAPRGQEKHLIDINSCDSLTLIALPGIGPVLSVRIIKYRSFLGGFASVEQLREVYGLPEETYEMIKGRLFADSSDLRKIKVNSADFRELSHIHYLEKYDISAILKYREISGRIKSIEDLKENKILAPDKADKVRPYLDFR
jgi:DNA uptake protein ComE-like DNA-binding protein